MSGSNKRLRQRANRRLKALQNIAKQECLTIAKQLERDSASDIKSLKSRTNREFQKTLEKTGNIGNPEGLHGSNRSVFESIKPKSLLSPGMANWMKRDGHGITHSGRTNRISHSVVEIDGYRVACLKNVPLSVGERIGLRRDGWTVDEARKTLLKVLNPNTER